MSRRSHDTLNATALARAAAVPETEQRIRLGKMLVQNVRSFRLDEVKARLDAADEADRLAFERRRRPSLDLGEP